MACEKWRHNNLFTADGVNWILCRNDYDEFWFNTDELPSDYKAYTHV